MDRESILLKEHKKKENGECVKVKPESGVANIVLLEKPDFVCICMFSLWVFSPIQMTS